MQNKMVISGLMLLAVGAAAPVRAAEEEADKGFLKGSTLDFTGINYFYDRDYVSGSGQHKRKQWAQGFIFDFKSGWTPGTIGFGVDMLGMFDFKLGGVPSEGGTGILPTDSKGPRHVMARPGIAGKIRVGGTELKIGTLIPKEPIIKASTSRVLPQTFQGGIIESKDIPGLDIYVARYTRSWYRDGVRNQALTLTNKNNRYAGTPAANHFDVFNVQYQLGEQVTLRYQTGTLDKIYRQQVFNIVDKVNLGEGTLRSELRYYKTDDTGPALAGRIDNKMLNALVTYGWGAHELGAAWQGLSGPTAMPWLGGTDADVFNWTFINDFLETKEQSWQLRYKLDGNKIGLKGWKFLTRYINADHARPATTTYEGREWQRDIEVDYQFQSESLKHFSVTWINAALRSNFQRNANENRIIIQYKVPLYRGDH